MAWLRLDSVAIFWIFGTISLDLQDLVRTHGGTARQAWVALEGQFLGNAEYRALQLDATFRTFEQGDLSVGEYCRRMKGMVMLFTTSGIRCPIGSWCSMSCGA